MADSKKNEIPSLFGDTLKSIVDAFSDDGKSTKKSSTHRQKDFHGEEDNYC